jgi:hypothetical protein
MEPKKIKNHLKKLLDQVRNTIRVKHNARKTEKSQGYWINKYIFFHRVQPGQLQQGLVSILA